MREHLASQPRLLAGPHEETGKKPGLAPRIGGQEWNKGRHNKF